MTRITYLSKWLPSLALPAAALFAGPACADIDLRVESRPIAGPIEAFIRVTNASGPVTGLTKADFAVALDGTALNTFAFSLPPDQDPAQNVSVVFVIDFGGAVQGFAASQIRDAVTYFINQMTIGDYAAIIKFRFDPNLPFRNSVVQPFTQIDAGTGTNMLISAAAAPFVGGDTPPFDAMMLGADQFATPPVALPDGPKAVILIDDGGDIASYVSLSDVVAHANENGIPIFTVSVGNIAMYPWATALMASLARDTGGTYFPAPDVAQIVEASATLASLLNSAYLLTIPQTAAADCNPHMLEVTSLGQSESIAFTRCDTTPDGFNFTDQMGVAPGAVVISDAVTITGIESPAAISVTGGGYSIGCSATFASTPGFILPGDEVCVRHTASANALTSASTLLIVGGVTSGFSSTTRAIAAPPVGGGGGGGGGGATGVVELLLGLCALLARIRRRL